MNCPTCDHTMLRAADSEPVFWCPRCGTLRTNDGQHDDVPALVERCREFDEADIPEIAGQPGIAAARWHTLGIAESIRLSPDKRTP